VDIFNVSFSMAFVIFTMIILRAFFIHKLPKKTFVFFWVVAMFRLIIPVMVPSRLSILNTGIMNYADMLRVTPERAPTMITDIPVNAAMSFEYNTAAGTALQAVSRIAPQVSEGPTGFDISAIPITTVLFWIWAVGAFVSASYFLYAHFRHCDVYRTGLPIKDTLFIRQWTQAHPLRRRLRIKHSDRIEAPLTYGIINPVILLPRGLLDCDEVSLSYILDHEYIHIRRLDTLTKWLLAATLAMHWFNPLVWIMYVFANRDIELSCDEAVISLQGDSKKTDYAMTLLRLAENRNGLMSMSSNFSEDAVEERVVSIMNKKKTSWIAMVAALAVVCCATVAFTTTRVAEPPVAEAPRAHAIVSEDVSLVPFGGGTDSDAPIQDGAFPGKIAIITNANNQNADDYLNAMALQAKYGADKVIHKTWPPGPFSSDAVASVLEDIAADADVRALIINQAATNTNAPVEVFREMRSDVFVVYCSPAESIGNIESNAHLILGLDDLLVGETVVMQAKSLGAKAFVHYSFQRNMSFPVKSKQRDIMKAAAEREGLVFIERSAPDPMDFDRSTVTQMFFGSDIPWQVELLGQDTAFFGANCGMQSSIIAQVIGTGALFPQPCCQSPHHGVPAAIGIADRTSTGSYDESGQVILHQREYRNVISETREALDAMGIGGRISAWAVPATAMWLNVGAEYAIEWINGRVSPHHGAIDLGALDRLAGEFAANEAGEPAGASFRFLVQNGVTYRNYVLSAVDYVTF